MIHRSSNYKALKPFFKAADNNGGHIKIESGAYMPLVIEHLCNIPSRGEVYSIAHYGEQNGDLMLDPGMELLVDHWFGIVTPMTYRNDYMGVFQTVFIDNDYRRYHGGSMDELDGFLHLWIKNIIAQGFKKQLKKA